jgi:hypothetical protein
MSKDLNRLRVLGTCGSAAIRLIHTGGATCRIPLWAVPQRHRPRCTKL